MPRYRDFPHLFWDMQPDAPVNTAHPAIVARVLERGSVADLNALLDPRQVRRELPTLHVPAHIARFWRRVLQMEVREPSGHRAQ